MLILERALESFIYLPCSCYLCDWRKGHYLGRADDEGNDGKIRATFIEKRNRDTRLDWSVEFGSFYGHRVVVGGGGKTVRHGGPSGRIGMRDGRCD
jgi:hypothetical protein